jgi:hypothetical protein
MDNIKEYIRKIVDEGNIEDMHTLSDILSEVIDIVKDYDMDCYKKYEMELYKMAYGETLSKDMAENIVSKMRPYGKRWNIEETENVQRQYGLNNINPIDFYVVLNSAYNDYKDLFDENIDMYVRFVNDFINDEDAKQGKVFKYFTQIAE